MRTVPALLVVLGLLQAGKGGWIYAKAEVAEILLKIAWSKTLEGECRVPPWPWADTWPVARMSFPEHQWDSVVLEGASGRVLAFAPGHLNGSVAPGEPGACVVAGHRDTQFAILERLRPGDPIDIVVADGSRHAYRVQDTAVLDKSDTWALDSTGGSELILVTCWPFDAVIPGGPERFVVWAEEVQPPQP